MYVNIWLACLCDFQERLTVGRKPESVADMIPEGEIILTINVYYPAVIDKVSFHLPRGGQKPSRSDSLYQAFFFFKGIVHVTDFYLPFPLSLITSDPT